MSDPITTEPEVTEEEKVVPFIENLKIDINRDVFPHFTLSHFTSENRVPAEEYIKVKPVEDGTYFNEDVVIDEYKKDE